MLVVHINTVIMWKWVKKGMNIYLSGSLGALIKNLSDGAITFHQLHTFRELIHAQK